MEVLYSDRAKKQLKKFDPPLQVQIVKRIDLLAHEQASIKWLRNGLKNIATLYVGKYRVLLEKKDSDMLMVRAIGHRQDIYKE